MMLDVKHLKSINLINSNFEFNLYLYELIFYSNHRNYLIIHDGKIIGKYNSSIWALRKFERYRSFYSAIFEL